eukprot:COSAG02_NODE_3372_length_6852_cov_9.984451_2_plen_163_part_00
MGLATRHADCIWAGSASALLNGLGLGHLLPTFEAEELGLPLLQKMAEDPAECAMVLDEVGVGMSSTNLPVDVRAVVRCHSATDSGSRTGHRCCLERQAHCCAEPGTSVAFCPAIILTFCENVRCFMCLRVAAEGVMAVKLCHGCCICRWVSTIYIETTTQSF